MLASRAQQIRMSWQSVRDPRSEKIGQDDSICWRPGLNKSDCLGRVLGNPVLRRSAKTIPFVRAWGSTKVQGIAGGERRNRSPRNQYTFVGCLIKRAPLGEEEGTVLFVGAQGSTIRLSGRSGREPRSEKICAHIIPSLRVCPLPNPGLCRGIPISL